MGEVKDVELVPGGADITVTNENLPKYMEAQLVHKLHDKVKDQVSIQSWIIEQHNLRIMLTIIISGNNLSGVGILQGVL